MVFAWMFVRSGARCRVPLALVPSEFAVVYLGSLVAFFCLHRPRMLVFLHQCGVLVFRRFGVVVSYHFTRSFGFFLRSFWTECPTLGATLFAL